MSHLVTEARAASSPGLFVRTVGAVSTVCGAAAAAMILLAVLITCQMIFVRFVLNVSTIWQTETVTYLVIGSTLVGLPYVQKTRGHVNVDLLSTMLPPAGRRALVVLTLAASLAVVGLLFWHGFDLFHTAWTRGWRTETVWGPPQWIPWATLPLGFGLFALQLLADLAEALTAEDA